MRKWTLCRPCALFRDKYDEVEQLKAQVGCIDDPLTGTHKYTVVIMHVLWLYKLKDSLVSVSIIGMLSKSKGQTLRVAVALHVLFNWEAPQSIPLEISDFAMKAAINFVDVSVQHATYLAGRRDLREEIDSLQ